jgi:hypothetical protein
MVVLVFQNQEIDLRFKYLKMETNNMRILIQLMNVNNGEYKRKKSYYKIVNYRIYKRKRRNKTEQYNYVLLNKIINLYYE